MEIVEEHHSYMGSIENLEKLNASMLKVSPLIYTGCAVYLATITIIGVFVNLVVIYTVCTDNKLLTPVNLVLLNLAFADSGIAVIGNPIAFVNALSGDWMFGKPVCVLYGFLMSLFGICSIYTLSLLAYQRYHIICRPFSNRSSFTWLEARLYVFGTWLCSFLVSLPPIFGWGSYQEEAANISCSINWESRETNTMSYIYFLFIVGLFIPIIVIGFSYSHILRTVRQAKRRMSLAHNARCTVRKAETHVAKMIFYMVVAFIVAWGPYVVFSLMIATGFHLQVEITIAPSLFAKSSVCYNPVIYFFLNSQFRKSFLRRIGLQKGNPNENSNDIRQLPMSHVRPQNRSTDYRDDFVDAVAMTNMSALSADIESTNVLGCFGNPIRTECADYHRQDMRIRMLLPCRTIPFVRKKYIMRTRSTHNLMSV